MKRKLIVAAICFMLALVINVYLSEVVFQVVGRTFDGFSSISFFGSLKSMTESATHRTIFWCIQIFVVLGLVLLIASRMVSMESKMITVTADIKTPAVAGQKQHGSARWQTKKEIFKSFNVARLDENNTVISELIKHGYDDLEFFHGKGGDSM